MEHIVILTTNAFNILEVATLTGPFYFLFFFICGPNVPKFSLYYVLCLCNYSRFSYWENENFSKFFPIILKEKSQWELMLERKLKYFQNCWNIFTTEISVYFSISFSLSIDTWILIVTQILIKIAKNCILTVMINWNLQKYFNDYKTVFWFNYYGNLLTSNLL